MSFFEQIKLSFYIIIGLILLFVLGLRAFWFILAYFLGRSVWVWIYNTVNKLYHFKVF